MFHTFPVVHHYVKGAGVAAAATGVLGIGKVYLALGKVDDQVQANPTVAQVEEARRLYLEKDAQALIGFGGGS